MAHPTDRAAHAVHPEFRPDIEGLRGLAVLLVVGFHAGVPSLTGGFIGVDVFFVLSGYLITGLLVAEHARTGRIAAGAFYARRLRRLLPASALMVLVTLALAALIYSPVQMADLARTALATAGYASNWHFATQAQAYFARDVQENPLLHTWSLAVEEQFYLVWPWVILLALGGARRMRRLQGALTVVIVGSAVACAWWTVTARPVAFYGMPWRAWEFALGGLAATLDGTWGRAIAREAAMAPTRPGIPRRTLRPEVLRLGLGWLGLAALIGAGIGFDDTLAFPGVWAWIPALGTVGVLLGARAAHRASVGRVLAAGTLQSTGRLSYAWYLWHWPVLVLGRTAWPAMGLLGRLGLVVLALGLAWASLHGLETPVRTWRRLVQAPAWRTLALGGGVTVALALLAGGYGHIADRLAQTPRFAALTAASQTEPAATAAGCNADGTDTLVHLCWYGAGVGHPVVALIGDSHAAHWGPALARLATATQVRLVVATRSGCGIADLTGTRAATRPSMRACTAWKQHLWDTLAVVRPATVVMSNVSGYVQSDGFAETGFRVTSAAWVTGLERTLRHLTAQGAAVIYIADVPRFAFDVPDCLMRGLRLAAQLGRATPCQVPATDAFNPPGDRASAVAIAAVPHTARVSLTATFCPAGTCQSVIDGVVAYRDSHHLSVAGAEHLAPALGTALIATGLWPGGPAGPGALH